MSRKKHYKGTFDYEGKIHILHCKAVNDNHAFSTLCVLLARKLNVSSWSVRQHFFGTDKYHIIQETSKNDTSGGMKDVDTQR